MNSFAQNINYIAGLDNTYGSKVELYKNNLSLKNIEHDIELKFSYYNNDDKKIHSIIHSEPGVLVGGINDVLLAFKSTIESSISGSEFTCTVSSGVQNFVVNNVVVISIAIDSNNDTYKAYELEAKVITSGTVTYDVFGEVSDTLKILPSLAMITSSDINAMVNVYEIKDEVITVSDSIASVTTVSDSIANVNITGTNITNVNIVGDDIANVNTVSTHISNVDTVSQSITDVNTVSSNIVDIGIASTNIASINTVANVQNLADIIRVADDLNSMDINGIADITIVANDLVLGTDSNIITVSDNIVDVNTVSDSINNVNTVGTNITDVSTVSTNIANVNITATNIASVNTVSSNIADVNTVSDGIVNVNTVSDSITNVNTVATNIVGLNSIVSSMAEILSADENAAIATSKASEASDSAAAALQSSIDAEASAAIAVDHIADKNNPHEVTKSQVGLGLVDNTADIDKVVASSGKLTNSVTIGGVSFDGSANIDLPGVNTEGNQNTTGSSAKWTNSRIITLSGDVAGTVNIDGSADVEMNVTVSSYAGHTHQFSSITNTPTTLNGYGITDAATSSHVHSASEVTTIDEFNNSNGTNVQDVLDDLDSAIDTEKGRIDAILSGVGANPDTFAEIVELINSVDTANDQVFAGYVLSNDARVLSAEQDISLLESSKADKSTTLAGYGITDAYTKTEVQETLPAIGLDTTNTVAPTRVGQFKWNQDDGTADLGLPNGVILQLGQENNRLVRASGNVTNGRLCMFDGTIGNSGRVKVKHFTGMFTEHSLVYGVATQDMFSGSDGYITINGKVRDIDTTGTPYGEVWADEDVIYAKPNDNGALTNVEPGDDQLKMIVATVIHAHTSGTLEIRVLPFNENMIAKRANKLTTSRNVLLSGDVSGSAYFDGSSDIDINVSVSDNSHNHTVSNITGLSLLNLDRADKYLASQNVANMVYDGSGKLTKVQYNNATDVDYEVLTYDGNGKLSNVAHYTTSVLRGNTVLSYSAGKLVSAIYTGV